MQSKDTVPSLYKQLLRERLPKLDNFDIAEVSNTLETMKKHEALLQALPENTFASLVQYIHHKRDIANKSLIVGKIITNLIVTIALGFTLTSVMYGNPGSTFTIGMFLSLGTCLPLLLWILSYNRLKKLIHWSELLKMVQNERKLRADR
ncbi:hypothetical protein P9G84_10235 [Brevibacillus centrosporus]|uniref:hypothetical protein n=1 Tax=Brevibacillus centrosporus TaxID=54910 RepID=UPI0011441C23|nr:hypothetical protein [Brevibacillus centrosporus]MEC2129346.1 hypothetical protein [Brevibacillus centrosporus]GED33513.1 hypothetical protein BCE02nite_46540 [Brevibacillus centrosporus]